jgi:hypothetical protein
MPKFIFHDDQGRRIHAGGLLLYDDLGFWVIKEFCKETYKLIDPGGKYVFQDCHIINTICREFCEETYFVIDISPTKVKELLDEKKAEMIYICFDTSNNPTYACILINTNHLNLKEDLVEKFVENRKRTLLNNPFVPPNYYSSFEFCYILFSEIKQWIPHFHYRLKQIFLSSHLKYYL